MSMRSGGLGAVVIIGAVALVRTSSPTVGGERVQERYADRDTHAGAAESKHVPPDSVEVERLLRRNVLPAYRAEPLAATVVDAESGEPLEGVIVVAHWEVANPYGAAVAQVMVMETTTDKQGTFAFPAWGPKRPDISLAPLAVAPSSGRLKYKDPELLLFKRDYMPLTLQNPSDFPPGYGKGAVRHSYWNRKTIKLRPSAGDLKAYAWALVIFDAPDLNFAFSLPDCSWKRIPRMILALDKEADRLKTEGMHSGPGSLENFDARSSPHAEVCGSLSEFMRSYKP
jgi:hypothetical protein